MLFFNFVYRHQRNKLKLDDVPKLPEWQRLRQQHAAADISVPNLVIRRPSLVQGPGGEYGSHPGSRKLSGGILVCRTCHNVHYFLNIIYKYKHVWSII